VADQALFITRLSTYVQICAPVLEAIVECGGVGHPTFSDHRPVAKLMKYGEVGLYIYFDMQFFVK
jgi:hypothetical protein